MPDNVPQGFVADAPAGFVPDSQAQAPTGFVPDQATDLGVQPPPSGTPTLIARGQTYGPIVGETGHDQMFGPKGNALGPKDVALSPDYQKFFPLGSKVMANGDGPYTVADSSFRSPGQPNQATVEFRDTANPPAQVAITPAPGQPPMKQMSDAETQQTIDNAQQETQQWAKSQGIEQPDITAQQVLGESEPPKIPNITALRQGSIKTAADYIAKQPQVMTNIADAAVDSGLGFVPKSAAEAAKMLTPIAALPEEFQKTLGLVRDWVNGDSLSEADTKNFPESQSLVQAMQSPPLSRARFKFYFDTALQLATAAGIAHGLAHPNLTEAPAPVQPQGLTYQPFADIGNQIQGAPNASQIASPAGISSGEVRPSVDETAPLQQQGQTAGTNPPQAQGSAAYQGGAQGQIGDQTPAGTTGAPEAGAGGAALGQGNGANAPNASAASVPTVAPETLQSPTGIRNAIVDQQRAARGLPERITPLRKTFGDSWDEASKLLDENPAAGTELVKELLRKPRPLSDVEDALLAHETVARENAQDNAVDAVNNATTDEERVSAEARLAAARDSVHELYDVGQKSGTETARGLAARRILVNTDFSLARMEATKRAVANGGKPLTDVQINEVKAAHSEIEKLKAKLDAYENGTPTAQAQRAFDMMVKQVTRETRAAKRAGSTLLSSLDSAADKARQRIIERRGQLNAGFDPTSIADEAIIGASYIAHGLDTLSTWSVKMVRDFGERIKPYLADIWKQSKALHDKQAEVFKGKSSETLKQEAAANAAGGAELSKKTVFDLARSHVQEGMRGLDNVMGAVKSDLAEAYPGITDRQIRDTFTDYGKTSFPSKAEDLATLRDLRRQGQLVSALEDAQSGKSPKRTGFQRDQPSDMVKELQKAVNTEMIRNGIQREGGTSLKTPLDRYKTYITNRTNEINGRIARNEYIRPIRNKTVLDAAATKLKADYERSVTKWETGLEKDRLANRTLSEKVQDTFVRWRRGFLLTSPVTIAKLTSAAAERMAITPAEELVGAGLSKLPLISKIAERAPREGGISVTAEAKALTEGFSQGMKDAWQILNSGRSDTDVTLGKRVVAPRYLIDFIGNIHGALKSIPKRNEFVRSFQKRTEFAINQGLDPSDPLVQTNIAMNSYKDANRSIFMQDNRVVSAYNAAVRVLESKSKITGRNSGLGKFGATVAKTVLPIVKVPTNIVAETGQYAVGSITGSVGLARAFRNGLENLKPEEADLIMRQLKKGSLGAAFVALGYFNANSVGGYYQPGKRDPNDVKFGAIRIGGYNVPTYLIHNPLMECLQIGATIKRVSDSVVHGEQQGIGAGAMAAATGVIGEVPFVREMTEGAKAFDPREQGKFLGNYTKGIMVPQGVQWLANFTDKNDQGNVTQRSPQSISQYIMSGIPGLRQQVPLKTQRGDAFKPAF